ncbi:S8 family serine peptidase [Herbihabitans rhizosphaerae]|uniref:S8 family serine peptidase n=1 Tax=Herbihabitans rhizosphaerae TaxID=1872711 RepID=UPI00102D21CF|nr:S8 family serine peptidase [Herbihabitans rhizosphaerae]
MNVDVIDSGIRSTHTEFGDRVRPGFAVDGGSTEDCWGHGTGVASLASGSRLGVSAESTVWAVRAVGQGQAHRGSPRHPEPPAPGPALITS